MPPPGAASPCAGLLLCGNGAVEVAGQRQARPLSGALRATKRPCLGPAGTFVLPAPGRAGEGHFISMADRWEKEDLGGSRWAAEHAFQPCSLWSAWTSSLHLFGGMHRLCRACIGIHARLLSAARQALRSLPAFGAGTSGCRFGWTVLAAPPLSSAIKSSGGSSWVTDRRSSCRQ